MTLPAPSRAAGRLLLYWIAVAFFVLNLLAQTFLPSRFFYDGFHIQAIAAGNSGSVADRSFDNVARVYQLLNLVDSPTLAGVVGYLVGLVGLGFSIKLFSSHRLSGVSTMLVITGAALSAIYLGWYSKDVFVIPVTVAALFALRSPRRGYMFLLIPLLAYGYLFRSYWMIIAVVFGAYSFVSTRSNWSTARKIVLVLVVGQFFLLAYSFYYSARTGFPADFARTTVNESRADGVDSASAISPWFDPGPPFNSFLNISITQLSLLVPWPLLTTGVLIHKVYALFIVCLWGSILRVIITQRRRITGDVRDGLLFGGVLMWSVLTVLAIFEPDYGSYLRHLTPLIPILLAMSLLASQAGCSKEADYQAVRRGNGAGS